MKKLAIILLCTATACTYNLEERKAAVIERATFDLDCPAEEITVKELDETSGVLGARGCGNTQTYQFWQNLMGMKWVLKEGSAAPMSPIPAPTTFNDSSYSVKPKPLFGSMYNKHDSLYGGRTFGPYNGYNGYQPYGAK